MSCTLTSSECRLTSYTATTAGGNSQNHPISKGQNTPIEEHFLIVGKKRRPKGCGIWVSLVKWVIMDYRYADVIGGPTLASTHSKINLCLWGTNISLNTLKDQLVFVGDQH